MEFTAVNWEEGVGEGATGPVERVAITVPACLEPNVDVDLNKNIVQLISQRNWLIIE